MALVAESLQIDRFNMGCRFEHYLLTRDVEVLEEMKKLMRGWAHGYIEYALDFAAAGKQQIPETVRQCPTWTFSCRYQTGKGRKTDSMTVI